jgi:multicomponent Na+:H+ antiporter subunit F
VQDVHLAVLILVLVGVLTVLPRVIRGPTLMDRILAVNVIGTKTIVLLALLAFLEIDRGAAGVAASGPPAEVRPGRAGFFLDIALVYALINFISTIAVMKYLERRARRSQDGGAS